MKPLRKQGLLVEEVEGEVLLFDESANTAAALNASATAVFELCDGTRDVEAIVAALAETRTPLDADAVMLALAELSEAGVVDDVGQIQSPSRREMLMRLGIGAAAAAAALPVVESIVAPTAAAALSNPTPNPVPTSPPPSEVPTSPPPSEVPTSPPPSPIPASPM